MKTGKRVLSIFLVVLMLLTAAPLAGFVGLEVSAVAPEFDWSAIGHADGTGSADDLSAGGTQGGIIQFGAYPQTEVTDSATISALNSCVSSWKSYGYYSGSGNRYDGQMTAKDFMIYCDVKYGGNKYRGVAFSQYRPAHTGDASSASDTFQDDNGYTADTTYWFKYEPLQWKVLDPSQGLVMCVSLIDSQPYNNYVLLNGTDAHNSKAYWGDAGKTYYANDYANSSLRQWLNETFYGAAFTEAQQNCIEENRDQNNDGYRTLTGNTDYTDFDSDPTNDKIFLLSYADVINPAYGFPSSRTTDTARQARGTDYAKCQGLHVFKSSGGSNVDGNSKWRLRTSGKYSLTACNCQIAGTADYLNDEVGSAAEGIRPVCKILNLADGNSFTSSEYEIAEQTFDTPIDYYSEYGNSSTYDPTLANLLCALSVAVYDSDKMLAAHASLGFCDGEYGYYNHYYDYSSYPNKCAYAIGYKASYYSDDIICLISVRGTDPNNLSDWITDFKIATNEEEKHTGFANPANDIFAELQQLNEVLEINGTVKYFITGHSLGAAVGNLLAVKLMENGVSSANIFDYNFACPDVACKSSFPDYDNIFNLCNAEDLVPFVPGILCDDFTNEGTEWGKFGRTYWFDENASGCSTFALANHASSLYLVFFNNRWSLQQIIYFSLPVITPGYFEGQLVKSYCPVDVIVTDTDGTRIASVIGGEINYYDSSFGDVIIMTDGDKKAIFVKGGLDFNVELIGTDTGEMMYSVENYDLVTGETLSVKTFSNVALENGKRMYSLVSEAATTEDVELFVVKEESDQSLTPIYTIDTAGAETEIAHIWNDGEITKAATCTEEGVKTFTCTLCGNSYTEPIGKKAHTLTTINQKNANCTEKGYTGDQYCTVCKQTISTGSATNALGHTTPDGNGNCTRCGTHIKDVTPSQPQPNPNACKWCGKVHSGFFQSIVGFFHRILAAIFGAKY